MVKCWGFFFLRALGCVVLQKRNGRLRSVDSQAVALQLASAQVHGSPPAPPEALAAQLFSSRPKNRSKQIFRGFLSPSCVRYWNLQQQLEPRGPVLQQSGWVALTWFLARAPCVTRGGRGEVCGSTGCCSSADLCSVTSFSAISS